MEKILEILLRELDRHEKTMWKYNAVMLVLSLIGFIFMYACIALVDHRLMILASEALNNAR